MMALRRNLRSIAAIAAGTLAATGILLSTIIPHHYKLLNVPKRYASLTHTQRVIVAFARKDGVGSGILYVWGGTTTSGFDCSGFVYHVLHAAGVNIRTRTTYAMFQDGAAHRVPRRDLRPGDVIFFSYTGSRSAPSHEGMYLGHDRFVEYYSSGQPARYGRLGGHSAYDGARRWWYPMRVRKRTLRAAIYVAHRWHLKIVGSKADTVVFVNPRHHHHFARWKRRAILRWAHRHHYAVRGYYTHINIRLHRSAA